MFHLDSPGIYQLIRNSIVEKLDNYKALRDKPIVVVSIFGPTSFHSSKKYKRAFSLALDTFGSAALFQNSDTKSYHEEDIETKEAGGDSLLRDEVTRKKSEMENNKCVIDGFYNSDESTLFLHLDEFFDSKECLEDFKNISKTMHGAQFIPYCSDLKSKYYKALLLLFSVSHILILSSNGTNFDTSYIYTFRALDSVRLDLTGSVVQSLREVDENVPLQWVEHGRLCSPRVLFLFEQENSGGKISKLLPNSNENDVKERLEHEIYQILRKCRIITNISANSLFAIPANQEFIFMFEKSSEWTDTQDDKTHSYFNIVEKSCQISLSDTEISGSRPRSRQTRQQFIKPAMKDTLIEFKEFVTSHTRVAFEEGGFIDDNRRVPDHKHFFVVPSLSQWICVFEKLSSFFFSKTTENNEALCRFQKFTNVDSEYLEILCSKAFASIYAAYQKNLPDIYSRQVHETKLTKAMNLYWNISRNPGILPWLNKLMEKCNRYWKNGRQSCETKSLHEYCCVNRLHRVAAGNNLEITPLPEMDKSLPEMAHTTGFHYTSYCNCGRRQCSRDEPFTIREANYDFYKRESSGCCDRYETHKFPIFVPTNEVVGPTLQDMISIMLSKSKALSPSPMLNGIHDQITDFDFVSQMENELRQDLLEDEEEEEVNSQESVPNDNEIEPELSSLIELEKQTMKLSITSDDFSINETDYTDLKDSKIPEGEQPSKHSRIEFLPGMLHSRSPPDLLPLFPSWALLCIGPSSLYSHNCGLTYQPGFLNGANYLLPWDVLVTGTGVPKPISSRNLRLRRGLISRHMSGMKTSNEFNVKVFIGMEYECKRAHRFMLETPEKVLLFMNSAPNLKGGGLGSKIATSDMPLYFPCPCNSNRENRDSRTTIAQLMRIHIVTPKAPVHVTVNPRVQPAPSAPTFFPGNPEPIKLITSSYYVLRIPYCYIGDDAVYPPPKDLKTNNGKLLKGLFDVIPMNSNESKEWELANVVT